MASTADAAIEAALQAWAPGYPRRVTKYQRWATSLPEAVTLLQNAETTPSDWPFISTYAFPEGHPSENAIPRIDRLFFDFDVPSDGEYRSGAADTTTWARDMSRLLVRTRKVAQFLLTADFPDAWQAVLSGHKGVHLDLTFPPISPSNGTFTQFDAGMATFANDVIDVLQAETGLRDLETYLDVSSATLAQLRRVPNTKHLGATTAFGEDRYCVPVTLAELAEIGPAEYMALTRSRRPVTAAMHPTPSEAAGERLTQHIRTATVSQGESYSTSQADPAKIDAYLQRQNENLTVADLDFVLSDRPCIQSFIEREDAFARRGASHMMELFAITHMIEKGVPIEVDRDDRNQPRVVGGTMVEFFAQHDEFDHDYTCGRIEEYLSRSYKPVTCEKIWDQAESFCLTGGCGIYRAAHRSSAGP